MKTIISPTGVIFKHPAPARVPDRSESHSCHSERCFILVINQLVRVRVWSHSHTNMASTPHARGLPRDLPRDPDLLVKDTAQNALSSVLLCHQEVDHPVLCLCMFPEFKVIATAAAQNYLKSWHGNGIKAVYLETRGPVHKQSKVNYNELELQFKSISSDFLG